MNKIFLNISILLFVFLSATAMCETNDIDNDIEPQILERLLPYEPSYCIYRNANDDEDAIRAHYSFKFVLNPDNNPINHEFFLKYTGEFDFYMSSRASGPVINRISNPGIHYMFTKRNGSCFKNFILGYEHRSNGQVTEVKSASEAAIAQQAYQQNKHEFFDGISRGSDYYSLGLGFFLYNVNINSKIKLYKREDSDITWGPLAGKDVSILDYDIFTINGSYRNKIFGINTETSLTWTFGREYFDTDSIDADLMLDLRLLGWIKYFDYAKNNNFLYEVSEILLPFYFRYHYGPMFTLSNYTEVKRSFGMGLKFQTF